MRHILLPTAEKFALRREYYTRLLTVGCFLFSVAILSGIVSMLPTYINARIKEKDSLNKVSSLKDESKASGLLAIEKELKGDSTLFTFLDKTSNKVHASSIIEDIIESRGNVTILSFDYARVSASSVSLIIQGKAPTRESLLAFKSRLESLAKDAIVELPVSQLAERSNIQFSLRFIRPLP